MIMSKLPKFSSVEHCPKCGTIRAIIVEGYCHRVSVRYLSKDQAVQHGASEDALLITCSCCSYSWLEQCDMNISEQ